MRPGTAMMVMFPLVLIAAAFVLVATRGARAADPHEDGVWWDEGIAQFVRSRIANAYVDKLDDDRASKAFYHAMKAYLHDLDEWCDLITPAEIVKWREQTRGEYAGLGIQVRQQDDGLEILGMLPGGPAATAGLQIGDTILAADGTSLAGLTTEDASATRLLKGPEGSAVKLSVSAGPRPEKGPATGPVRIVTVSRVVVRSPSVFPRRLGKDGQFGVIRIREFTEATADDFDRALAALLRDGVKGLLLDLRENPGGVLPAAEHVADRFLSKGLVVRMEGRSRGSNQEYAAREDPGDVPDTVPVAVLVNGNSASASEVVAGALQDHRRALLVGERTFGKFLVQQIVDIPGRQAAVELTYARYYTPSGRSYQRRPGERQRDGTAESEGREPAGLLPDVPVPLDAPQLQTLRKAFVNEEGQPWGEKPAFPEVAADYVDPQTQRALEILEGELVLRKIHR
jgi:carboxyl-terminal processing protease